MEAEAVINLFDAFWFHVNIFQNQSKAPTLIQQNPSKPINIVISTPLSRSKSDEVSYISSSPDSVLKPHLQTIEAPKPQNFGNNDVVIRKKKRFSKSLSELEFEEVKGFMDLGFVFPEDDKPDSRLVQIIPGLQRLGHNEINEELRGLQRLGPNEELRMRPYLSEAWKINNRNKAAPLMMDWRIGDMNNEDGMKDSLKCWAHTVASAVR